MREIGLKLLEKVFILYRFSFSFKLVQDAKGSRCFSIHDLFTEYLLLIAYCVHIYLIKHHGKEQLKIKVKRKYVKQHRRNKNAR